MVVAMARMDIDPEDAGVGDFYKLLTAVVVPRPIAWVSSRSAEGVDNLAPHSFFTVAAIDPPVVQFTSVGRKDSLNNVEATKEFVVNLAPEWLFEQINASGTAFPPHVSEFDAVGIEREPSLLVAPPRVAGSPVALECVLHATSTIGHSTVVLGRVVNAATRRSSANATFSRNATGAVLWLIPRMFNAMEALWLKFLRILVYDAPLDQG